MQLELKWRKRLFPLQQPTSSPPSDCIRRLECGAARCRASKGGISTDMGSADAAMQTRCRKSCTPHNKVDQNPASSQHQVWVDQRHSGFSPRRSFMPPCSEAIKIRTLIKSLFIILCAKKRRTGSGVRPCSRTLTRFLSAYDPVATLLILSFMHAHLYRISVCPSGSRSPPMHCCAKSFSPCTQIDPLPDDQD